MVGVATLGFFKAQRKKYFNLRKFKYNKDYKFDHTILTDGIGVSIRFIHKNYNKQNKQNKQNNGNFDSSIVNDLKYITDLSDDKIKIIKTKKCIYIDPNKNVLLYCMNDNEQIFKYTRAQRLKETQRTKINNTIQKLHKKQSFLELSNKV